MTSRRRGTFWMEFSEGAVLLTLAFGGISRLLIPSLREGEVGREYEGYTVTRTIFNLFLHSTGAEVVCTAGIIILPESVGASSVDPTAEPAADWLWREEFVAPASADEPLEIHRDVGSQRKARGGETEQFFYVVNRSGVAGVELHRSGRTLVKRA